MDAQRRIPERRERSGQMSKMGQAFFLYFVLVVSIAILAFAIVLAVK